MAQGFRLFPPGHCNSGLCQIQLAAVCLWRMRCIALGSGCASGQSVPGDAAHYHLARAQYWIQNHSPRHFFTDDYRQVEFPPNSSFLSMWQILVTGRYANLNVIQWLAAMLSALAIGGLSEYAGHNAAKSAFAGLTYLTLSSVVLQMATPLDDNLTAWLAVSLVYFVLLSIRDMVSSQIGPGHSQSRVQRHRLWSVYGNEADLLVPATGIWIGRARVALEAPRHIRSQLPLRRSGAASRFHLPWSLQLCSELAGLRRPDHLEAASRQVAFGDILQTNRPPQPLHQQGIQLRTSCAMRTR